jgi:hypothetical protein
MTSALQNCEVLNDANISLWDVSIVEDMTNMFAQCFAFNRPLNNWDVSSVVNYGAYTGMDGMFINATSFNQDLSDWDVSAIPTKPSQFDQGATAWAGGTATRPQWGTSGSH